MEWSSVTTCYGHIGKKSINPTLDEFIAALVGVAMADNDGMVIVADVDNVNAVVVDNNPIDRYWSSSSVVYCQQRCRVC
jgi:uncharacterized membrane protein